MNRKVDKVEKLKVGLMLIILENILYMCYIYSNGNEGSSTNEFSSDLLFGLSIGINLVGIINSALYVKNNSK
mgnify:CR=1 FL=1